MTEPILNDLDRQSATWLKIKAWAEDRQDMHRRMNDNDLPDVKTTKLRGRIAELDALLRLGEKPEVIEIEPDIPD